VTLDQARFIDAKVESGDYASESEVIRDGLRALAERDRAVDRWLRETIGPRFDAAQSGGAKTRNLDAARQQLTQRLAEAT